MIPAMDDGHDVLETIVVLLDMFRVETAGSFDLEVQLQTQQGFNEKYCI